MIECVVCGGEGYYPIYDKFGSWRYSINCPECFGRGSVEDIINPVDDLPPASTASRIRSTEELRAYLGKGDGG